MAGYLGIFVGFEGWLVVAFFVGILDFEIRCKYTTFSGAGK